MKKISALLIINYLELALMMTGYIITLHLVGIIPGIIMCCFVHALISMLNERGATIAASRGLYLVGAVKMLQTPLHQISFLKGLELSNAALPGGIEQAAGAWYLAAMLFAVDIYALWAIGAKAAQQQAEAEAAERLAQMDEKDKEETQTELQKAQIQLQIIQTQAEAQKAQAEAEAKKAEAEADAKKAEAEAQKEAARITADAQKEVAKETTRAKVAEIEGAQTAELQKIKAEAEATAIRIKAEAEAEINKNAASEQAEARRKQAEVDAEAKAEERRKQAEQKPTPKAEATPAKPEPQTGSGSDKAETVRRIEAELTRKHPNAKISNAAISDESKRQGCYISERTVQDLRKQLRNN